MVTKFFYDIEILEVSEVDDGIGGTTKTLSTKGIFKGAICMVSPKIIQALGTNEVYPLFDVLTDKTVMLKEGQLIKDIPSQKVFEISQDNTLKETPRGATLNLRVAQARYYLQS